MAAMLKIFRMVKEKKRKVVYILHDFKIGGVEVALLSALETLNEAFDFRLVILGKIDQTFIRELNENISVKIIAFPYKYMWWPSYLLNAALYIIKFKPDTIISSLWRAYFLGVCLKFINRKVVFISFIHNTSFHHIFDKIFTLISIKVADYLYVDSEATALFVKNLVKGIECKVISFVVQNGPSYCDIPDFNAPIRIVYIGRISDAKNVPLAIKFVCDLQSKGINVTFDIYGNNEGDIGNVLNTIKHFNAKKFIALKGQVLPSEKTSLYKKYNFYLQLSKFEGMSMSVAEAMQNGLVCLVNPTGEISNYATDMVSAVFINCNKGSYNDSDLEKAISVMRNEKLFKSISNSSYSFFKNKKLYKDSLKEEILKCI